MLNCGASRLLKPLVVSLLLYAISMTYAGAQIVSFNRIDQSSGLQNGNVRAIIKDHQGFMWFGTEDGLFRYDGYGMKGYRKDEHDTTSISSNFILSLFEDSEKNLWIGTLDGGLCWYDRRKDSFMRLRSPGTEEDRRIDNAIRMIYENEQKELFFGAGHLLRTTIKQDPRQMTLRRVRLPIGKLTNSGIRLMDIENLSDSSMLLAIHNLGMYLYNPKTDVFEEHPVSNVEKNIQAFHIDKRRKLIFSGTWKQGMLVCDYSGKTYRRIRTGNDKHTLRNDYVPQVTADSIGNIWASTDYGLSMIPYDCDPMASPIVETFLPDPQNPSSLQGSIIKTVYVDPEDNIWVGAYYNGISVYHKRSTHFGAFSFSDRSGTQAPGFLSVSAIVEDNAGTIWLGTDGSGMYRSRNSLEVTAPIFDKIHTCSDAAKVKAMKLDKDGNLWVGTWGKGLVLFNTRTGVCRNFETFNPGPDIGTEVTSLEIDSIGDVWIGTFDNGFYRYSSAQNKIVHLESTQKQGNFIDRVNTIYQDDSNTIWIGKESGGLNRAKTGSLIYEIVESDHLKSSTTVTAIHSDNGNALWIGCPSNGLVRLDVESNRSILFSESDGLANSMIYSILPDKKGRLWISTDAGVSVFNKATRKFINFGPANGLLSNQFNKGSALLSRNGFLVFGSVKGASFIAPESITLGNQQRQVVFTKLFVNNKEQLVGREGSVLAGNIVVTRRVDLNHEQNSFSVEVSALDFDFSDQPEYYYKLEGFNDTWQYAGSQRMIQYTNLEPKTYTLHVSTTANPGPGDSVAILEVVIRPAWWQTTLFKVSSILLLGAAAFSVHRFRISYLLAQKRHLEQQVNERTQTLNQTNDLLTSKLQEINSINAVLQNQKLEIVEKNNEILTQNEELTAQNEQIANQHEKLVQVQAKLTEINQTLEKTVDERTHALQSTIDDLNKIVFELDRFVYSASHDLSAPLKSILGLVQIINLEPDQSRIIEYAGRIRESVQKLETVIKSMVDYARNSHVQVTIEEFNLARLVDDVVSDLAFLPEAQRIVFDNLVDNALVVQNDPSRVKVILHNLIGNGIKYIDKHKERSFVRVEASREGSNTTVKISDNGIGIRHEFLDKVFNMYFRGTEVSKGSGLGLFIVKETVHKIGGSIAVNSTFGAGTSFTVVIPQLPIDKR
jgi:signal transduction histidine kinase/ligand-binding sensor domain-containing protein